MGAAILTIVLSLLVTVIIIWAVAKVINYFIAVPFGVAIVLALVFLVLFDAVIGALKKSK